MALNEIRLLYCLTKAELADKKRYPVCTILSHDAATEGQALDLYNAAKKILGVTDTVIRTTIEDMGGPFVIVAWHADKTGNSSMFSIRLGKAITSIKSGVYKGPLPIKFNKAVVGWFQKDNFTSYVVDRNCKLLFPHTRGNPKENFEKMLGQVQKDDTVILALVGAKKHYNSFLDDITKLLDEQAHCAVYVPDCSMLNVIKELPHSIDVRYLKENKSLGLLAAAKQQDHGAIGVSEVSRFVTSHATEKLEFVVGYTFERFASLEFLNLPDGVTLSEGFMSFEDFIVNRGHAVIGVNDCSGLKEMIGCYY